MLFAVITLVLMNGNAEATGNWITVMDTFVPLFSKWRKCNDHNPWLLDFFYFDWEPIYHGSRMPPGYCLEIYSERAIDFTVHMHIYQDFFSQQKINSSYYLAILNSEKSLKDRLKAFALTPGSKLVVPRSVPLSQNLKWRKF